MVRTRHFHCQDPGSIPGLGTEILQATQTKKKKKKEEEAEAQSEGRHSTRTMNRLLLQPACACHCPEWPSQPRSYPHSTPQSVLSAQE